MQFEQGKECMMARTILALVILVGFCAGSLSSADVFNMPGGLTQPRDRHHQQSGQCRMKGEIRSW